MRLIYRYVVLFASTLSLTFLFLFFFNFRSSSSSSGGPRLLTAKVIRTEVTEITKTNPACRYHSCFDVLKCNPNKNFDIKVFVYPDQGYVDAQRRPILPMRRSYEFNAIIDAIRSSKYATSNPEEACLFVPAVDLLAEGHLNLRHVSAVLSSLPYWNDGTNHLIFNFFPRLPTPPSVPLNIDVGNAIIASSNIIVVHKSYKMPS